MFLEFFSAIYIIGVFAVRLLSLGRCKSIGMVRRMRHSWIIIVGLLILCAPLHAGMPMITINEVTSLRVETLSFFAALFLLCGLGLKLLWNYLARDFTRLPRLTYGKSLGLLVLWGLFFVLVLTMISGARELMTPGAWVKQGATYKVAADSLEPMEMARRQRLELLRTTLWQWAERNNGQLPPHDLVSDIAPTTWQVLDPSAMRYIYLPGSTRDGGHRLIAYEPGVYGKERLALFADGEIAKLPLVEIKALMAPTP